MENTAEKHRCGVCNDEWLTEGEYNAHVCPQTQHTPQEAEHLIASTDPGFADVQKAALERGLESIQAQGATPEQVAVQEEAIQQLQ
jgi:hypothetical protein